MLRSLGIPARLAVGYAEGERTLIGGTENILTQGPDGELIPQEIEPQADIYSVRHQDAHAWPEVFFPNIGWVEFEPTVSQQPLIRPTGLLSDSEVGPAPANQLDELRARAQRSLEELSASNAQLQDSSLEGLLIIPTPVWFALIVIVLIAMVFLFRRIRIQRGSPPIPVQIESSLERVGIKSPKLLHHWARYASISPLSRAYLELNRALSRLGQSPSGSDTPSERARDLVQLLPVAETPVQAVLTPYQNSIYGNQPSDPDEAQTAGKEIRKLSYLARFQRFLARFQDPKQKDPSTNITKLLP
jgi:hypothetical protein